MKLEPELRADFMAEAQASQVLRELMREFVERQREKREYGLKPPNATAIAQLRSLLAQPIIKKLK